MSYGIEKALKERGSAVIVPTGNSMRPLLWPDQDSVALEARAAYHIFDIVLYKRSGGDYILHRIVGKDGKGFVLCGDNQTRREYGVSPEQILGAAREWFHNGKARTPGDPLIRAYVFFWCRLFPLRRPIFFARRCMGWLKRKITGKRRTARS